jgi:hypothetical protein
MTLKAKAPPLAKGEGPICRVTNFSPRYSAMNNAFRKPFKAHPPGIVQFGGML